MSNKNLHANIRKNRTPRHRAREFALQGLYQWLLNNEASVTISENIRHAHGFYKADSEHFNSILHGAINNVSMLRNALEPLVDRRMSSLSPVEHAVLLIGAFELSNHFEIPYCVVINEAVELAKSFGGTEGYKYVNGVLDKLADKVRTDEIYVPKKY